MKYTAWFLVIGLFVLASCGGKKEEEGCVPIPDASGVEVNIEFESLSDTIASIKTKEQLAAFLDKHKVLREVFFKRYKYPTDSAFINRLYSRFTNFGTLNAEVKRVFGDESKLKAEFTEAFKNLKYHYPDIKIPKIKTVISGFDGEESDMLVSDSLIVIGLDYFLGRDAKYRPDMYDYMLLKYNPENIVPSIMMLYGIDGRINRFDSKDQTALAEMIAYGKSFYFAKQMMPCTPDSVFIWYSSKEIKGASENQDLIWARFIEDKLLYSTSHMLNQKYLRERPKTVEVGPECPGRIGQWVGWQIVKSYMKSHPDKKLTELMGNQNADRIFKESKYRPVRK